MLFCHLPTPLHCPLKCSYSIDFNLLIVCNNLFQFTSVIPLHGRSFLNRCANKNNGNAKKRQGKASTKRIKVNDENAARQVGLRKSATKRSILSVSRQHRRVSCYRRGFLEAVLRVGKCLLHNEP